MSGPARPVAVTGIGIVSPLGISPEEHWAGVVAGTRAVKPLTLNGLDQDIPQPPGWDQWAGARLAGGSIGLSMSHFRICRLSAVLSREALGRAGLSEPPQSLLDRAGVVFGASKPVLSPWFERDFPDWEGLRADDPEEQQRGNPFRLSGPAGTIAEWLDFGGPALAPNAACATGLVSIIRGAELIRGGDCDVVIAGSADNSLHPAYLAAYRRMGVLAPPGDDPGQCCRPFDARRNGFAVGEGAATLVLENIDHARRRGATILAEILGAGLTADNDSLVDVDPCGASLSRALRDALRRSNVRPGEIDAVSLHGTGTRLNDVCETNALKLALGEHAREVSCFSLKGAIGHLMGAAGSVETATLIQAMQHGVVPPTVNLEHPDPDCDLDYTPVQPRSRPIRTAVKLSLGFGGTCAAVVIRRPE
ncbi:MAG TPA: beta-ketoacyl-[acyl-carrier-protein] synthase family protein [Caulifigura sp.]|nr:beta-ketoacyl-[acyl-carrier-protein] synthase family protein [Caulifigura sp.]